MGAAQAQEKRPAGVDVSVVDGLRVFTTELKDDVADIDELMVDAYELADDDADCNGCASCWSAWGTAEVSWDNLDCPA